MSEILLSIITINYNDKIGLSRTINSVKEQNTSHTEHIIIDGNSDDGSQEVILEYQDSFSCWISEEDKGVYDAMNKGLRHAKGKYVLFLNSRDIFYTSTSLNALVSNLNGITDIYYADVLLSYPDRSEVKSYAETLNFSYLYEDTICHQSTVFKKDLFDRVGPYNLEYKIIADWEFLIKALFLYKATYKKLDFVFSQYDMNGMSSFTKFKKTNKEDRLKVVANNFGGFLEDYSELKHNRYLIKVLENQVGVVFFKMMKKPFFLKSLKIFTILFSSISKFKPK